LARARGLCAKTAFPYFCLLPQNLRGIVSLSLRLSPNLDELVVDYVREVVWISGAFVVYVAIELELRSVDKVNNGFKEEGVMASI
jgi:hypothetical protein